MQNSYVSQEIQYSENKNKISNETEKEEEEEEDEEKSTKKSSNKTHWRELTITLYCVQ